MDAAVSAFRKARFSAADSALAAVEDSSADTAIRAQIPWRSERSAPSLRRKPIVRRRQYDQCDLGTNVHQLPH